MLLEGINGDAVLGKKRVFLEVFNVFADSWNGFLDFEGFSTFVTSVFEHNHSFHHNIAVDINLTWYVSTV